MGEQDELWCPRRAESGSQWPGPDTWRATPSLTDGTDAATPTCSYCGSLEPQRFLDLVEAGWIVGPTDKSYKAYLTRPLTEDEVAVHKQRWLQNDTVAVAVRRVEQASGKAAEEIDAILDKRWAEAREWWSPGSAEAKFYFMHLTTGQKRRFIELYNTKAMKIGYPGHFYVPPYFVSFDRPGSHG